MVQTPGFKNQLNTFFLCLPRSTQLFILPTENHSFLPCRPWMHRQTREHECRGSSAASHPVLEKAHTDAGPRLSSTSCSSGSWTVHSTSSSTRMHQGIRFIHTCSHTRCMWILCCFQSYCFQERDHDGCWAGLPNALPTSQSCAIVR